MKQVGFVGAFDKTDLIIYIAKILTVLGKRVLIADTTITQKAKYVVPALNPTLSYITEFEEIDIAVGFKNVEAIANYTNRSIETLEYDYLLLDIDSAESAMNFRIDRSVQNFFVTSFDTYDIRRGIEILNQFQNPIKMTKVLFSKEVTKEDDEYLNYLSLGAKVMWEDDRIYFPLEMGDKTAIINNQKVAKVRFENLTSMYKDGMEFIIAKIDHTLQGPNIRKIIKEI
ncbi:MAG TPA: hypothetical protein OIM48_03225 [Clostridiaceae bacterium]|jgi:hypothetical protein|nr:hypothetical protein [Clostridia bacterium]HJJ12302.1 hypothetical protein [Clostridiaceae bacterium]